jgi:hypothetical protein
MTDDPRVGDKLLRDKLCLMSTCSFDEGCGCLAAIAQYREALAATQEPPRAPSIDDVPSCGSENATVSSSERDAQT